MQSEIATNKVLHGIDAEVFEFVVKEDSLVTKNLSKILTSPMVQLLAV